MYRKWVYVNGGLTAGIAASKIPASCKQQTAVAEALADCKQQAGL